MEQDDLVTVFEAPNTSSAFEAENVKALLESEGIESVLIGDSRLPLPYEVRVTHDDAERARQLIAEAKAAGPSGATEAEQETEPR